MKILLRLVIIFFLTCVCFYDLPRQDLPILLIDNDTVTIAIHEGFFHKGTIPNRLNNPGSLSFAHQPYATEDVTHFAHFDKAFNGWYALMVQINKLHREHKPLKKLWTYLK